jgi:hypothetical protein
MRAPPWFGRGCPCDLSRFALKTGGVLANEPAAFRAQNRRASGVYRRLCEDGAPGVLLADEVGKGKTYVALGVVFALLARKRRSRVVILTHSGRMAKEWEHRWRVEMKENCRAYGERFEEEWAPSQFASITELCNAYDEDEPPRVAIGSYETLKKYGDKLDEVYDLHEILGWVNDCFGVRLTKQHRRELIRSALGRFDFRRALRRARVSRAEAHRLLRACFDPDAKEWKVKPHRVRDFLDEIQAERHRIALPRQIDLLVVDEAHKLEGTARRRVITLLLHKRFRKCLFVTATPFALSVEQFRRRLREFEHASTCTQSFRDEVMSLPLGEFADAVANGGDYPKKKALEGALRKYMVRDTWDHAKTRSTQTWRSSAQEDTLVPTLILERIIDGVLADRGQTHIASRRESLCSSWAAAALSVDRSPLPAAAGWSDLLRRAISAPSGSPRPDPKMLEAVGRLAKLALGGEKAVVFTQRIATAKLLQKLLATRLAGMTVDFNRQSERWRRHVDALGNLLGLACRAARVLAKVLAHAPDAPNHWDPVRVRAWWNRHRPRAFPQGEESLLKLEPALGKGRRLPLVVRFDSESGAEDAHPIEKFNLPSAPLVLIASPKGQEGIDLHRYCRRVVLYDLTWNPAHMEQRIGRVHRLGGAHSAKKKVEVVYCYQEGTYEALMAKRVQDRCRMLRVLLGAGQWLDQDEEIEDVERYRMSFPP